MVYRVTKKFTVKPEYADSLDHSTMEEFKTNVMQLDEKGESDYIQVLKDANIDGWAEKESDHIAARNRKTESFDAEEKAYIVSRDWDSIDQWNDHVKFHIESSSDEVFKIYYDESIISQEEI